MAEFKNVITNFGLTALASAPANQYTPPTFLVIDTAYTTMAVQGNPGNTSIQLNNDPTISGDTQLVLSVGLAAQETVTFSSKSGTGPYTFNLSAGLTNTHPINDPVVRQPRGADTMASVLSEAQYDPTYNAGNRVPLAGGYSPGSGQNTSQFFMSGSTATNLFFAHVGLTDQQAISALNANLHNYAALGYNHNNTNDLEIDVTYTLTAV